jgi:hypothetical protein
MKSMEQANKKIYNEDHRRLMDDNVRVQEGRTKEFKDRFVRFNEQEKVKRDIYFNSVNPEPSKKDELNAKLIFNNGGMLNNLHQQDMQGRDDRKNHLMQAKEDN